MATEILEDATWTCGGYWGCGAINGVHRSMCRTCHLERAATTPLVAPAEVSVLGGSGRSEDHGLLPFPPRHPIHALGIAVAAFVVMVFALVAVGGRLCWEFSKWCWQDPIIRSLLAVSAILALGALLVGCSPAKNYNICFNNTVGKLAQGEPATALHIESAKEVCAYHLTNKEGM